jgi:hypothetical protein
MTGMRTNKAPAHMCFNRGWYNGVIRKEFLCSVL